jgi:2-oxoglutarate dehydrogenase, E1 component
MSAVLKQLQLTSHLSGANAAFIEELYERYLENPDSVENAWRDYFDSLTAQRATLAQEIPHTPVREAFARLAKRGSAAQRARSLAPEAAQKQAAVLRLLNAYRVRGHQQADLDPLRLAPRPPVPDLDPTFHRLGEVEMDTVYNTGSLVAAERLPLREILAIVQEVYAGHIGSEYMHITNTNEKRWIQRRLESCRARPDFSNVLRRRILERLSAAEGIEKYLHSKYVGQKRFSLEGGESLIPLFDHLIQRAGERGVREIVIGMAHRGRLNVLVNILGKSSKELFQEFEGKPGDGAFGSGDAKYHLGYSTDIQTLGGVIHIALAFNPSHLEIIDPVVEGSVRARQQRHGDLKGDHVLPLLIHGDAAFAGQGVVMETLQLSQSRGFGVGGTVHVIVNNQIGFTTSNALDARSTLYCTDVAKMVQAPIFHVNGDDPEAVIFVTQFALDFRMEFKKDVVIDMICYRRHGHNEADEPAITQPMMYQKIKNHPTVRQIYAERLVAKDVVSREEADKLVTAYRDALDEGQVVARNVVPGYHHAFLVDWTPYKGVRWDCPVDTAVPVAVLRELAAKLEQLPEGFQVHPRVAKIMQDRHKMAAGGLPVDWGFAETLAYATLLNEGYQVRLSGQDSGRGTFAHRHAVLHSQADGSFYIPLAQLSKHRGDFFIIDSLLSEEAVLGFEYGYSTAEPQALVIWEAQFGDFANGAQVVIDQFISSGYFKWGRLCGLVMFLPHGYEGQGPEHSSARLERYLQLCAEQNMRVCVPTTPLRCSTCYAARHSDLHAPHSS